MKLAALIFLCVLPALCARQVAVLTEGQLDPPARYGIAKLEQALSAKGLIVIHSAAGRPTITCQAGVGKGAPQSLTIRRTRYQNKPAVNLSGGDARGLMYAALDVADRTTWSGTGADPFARVRDTDEAPYLVERGVSMFTMHRAYFESKLYDEKYWERYFDLLAASRINNFIVIFFGYVMNGGFIGASSIPISSTSRSIRTSNWSASRRNSKPAIPPHSKP